MGEIEGHLGSDVFHDFEEMRCGDLLIALLKAMRPLPAGTLVEVRALDPGAPIDIPAWCRMVGHALLVRAGGPQNTHAENDTDRATVGCVVANASYWCALAITERFSNRAQCPTQYR